jgi:tetratricopeptide (TPR) repeat protein
LPGISMRNAGSLNKKVMSKITYMRIACAICLVVAVCTGTYPATVKDLDREAQAHRDKRDLRQAINLWLGALEIEPDNEHIQLKIEEVYETKLKKDNLFEISKRSYRIARIKLKEEKDIEIQKGIDVGKSSINDWEVAAGLDPFDDEIKGRLEDMKILDQEIRAAIEKLRLSQAKRERIENLKKLAREEMKKQNPDYKAALNLWEEVLSIASNDGEAQEGKRKCLLALEDLLRYNNIRRYMAQGKEFFERNEFRPARREFQEVLNLDPRHREARDYIEKINDLLEETAQRAQRMEQAESFYRSGINNVNNNKFDAAREDFETALALIKDYKDARQRLNEIDRLRKIFDERDRARRIRLIEQKFQEGIIEYTQGKYKAASDAFIVTLRLDENHEGAKEYLQRALEALRLEEEEVVEENSPLYDIVRSDILAGKDLFARNNFTESKKRWERILNIRPKNKIAREYITMCDIKLNPEKEASMKEEMIRDGKDYLEKKDYRAAFNAFEIIKSIDRKFPNIDILILTAKNGIEQARAGNLTRADVTEIERRLQAGNNLYQRGDYRGALENYEWVIKKYPNNAQAWLNAEKIRSRQRIGAEGERRLVLTDENRMLVRRHLFRGIGYYNNKNYQKALQEWGEVLKIEPKNNEARNNIIKLRAMMQR